MKVECSKENLVDNIAIAEKTTGKNVTLPVLECLFLEARDDNTLTIRATNIDLGIEITIPAKVEESGIAVVPGSVLLSAISSVYDSTTITLLLKDTNIIVSTPRSKTTINTLPVDDFPTLPEIDKDDVSISINTGDFVRGLQNVWYSASTTTIKQELAAVYVYTYDKKIIFVATDSFRLGEKTMTAKKTAEFEPILIPIKNVVEIIKVLEFLGDQDVDVYLNENQISFKTDSLYLTSRLIDGNFPDYRQILPKEFSSEVILLKQDFINILKKINIFSDKSNQVQFEILPSKKKVILKAHNQDVGETIETIDAAVTGEDLTINFNHKYIADALSSINSDSISLSFTGLSKPMVMKGISDASFLYLVMPMNK